MLESLSFSHLLLLTAVVAVSVTIIFRFIRWQKNQTKAKELLAHAIRCDEHGAVVAAIASAIRANDLNSTPHGYYFIGYLAFKLQDYNEAPRNYWKCTITFIASLRRKKGTYRNRYWQEFFCHGYFMWALSEAMRGSWGNCEKYCGWALNNLSKGELRSKVPGQSAPLIEYGDYDTGLQLLRQIAVYHNADSDEPFSSKEANMIVKRLKLLPTKQHPVAHFIEILEEGKMSKTIAAKLWELELAPSVKAWNYKSGIQQHYI